MSLNSSLPTIDEKSYVAPIDPKEHQKFIISNYPLIPLRLDKWMIRSTFYSLADVKHLWNSGKLQYIPDPNDELVQKVYIYIYIYILTNC